MKTIRQNVKELNRMILNGEALEAFERFYAETVSMQENSHEPTVGKEANRKKEEEFFSSITDFRGAEVLNLFVKGNQSFVLWHFDYTHKDWGVRNYNQLAVQTWNDKGQILDENFIYNEEEENSTETRSEKVENIKPSSAKRAINAFLLTLLIGLGSIFSFSVGAKAAEKSDSVELNRLLNEQKQVNKNLKVFDELDFDVFTNQKWDRLSESHDENIVVHWPDGRITHGLKDHTDDLKALFVWAPDINIRKHPIKFGSGNFTVATGEFKGTFTKPMPTPTGELIQPTGKSFNILMATIGRWKNGRMVEEWLFWDNLDFMKQIGLAQ